LTLICGQADTPLICVSIVMLTRGAALLISPFRPREQRILHDLPARGTGGNH
jgi:hypothetical protein